MMTSPAAALLKGAPVAKRIKAQVSDVVASLDTPPCLLNVLVGHNEAALSYLGSIDKLAARLGIDSRRVELPADVDTEDLCRAVTEQGADPSVHALMVQFPLPKGLDRARVAACIPPAKDVDGATIESLGAVLAGQRRHTAPATAAAVVELLASEPACDPEGKDVVIIGRSLVVGRPLGVMLGGPGSTANGTPTICHRRSPDVPAKARRADVLVVAAGVRGLVTREWVKPGAVVVDVGTHPIETEDGWTLVGDVDPTVAEVAGWFTPVPGGVGPVTNAVLMRHVAAAAAPTRFESAW